MQARTSSILYVPQFVKNSAFTPRWEKEKKKDKWIIQTCNCKELCYSHTITTSDQLVPSGLDVTEVVPTPFPICKHHYFATKNKANQTTKCNTSLRNALVSSCLNSNLINKYLLEQTGFEGNLLHYSLHINPLTMDLVSSANLAAVDARVAGF